MPRLGQLEGLAPVAQEDPVGLIRHEHIQVGGSHADSVSQCRSHFRNHPVPAGQDLGDLRLREADVDLSRTRLPVLALRLRDGGHIRRELAEGPRLGAQHRVPGVAERQGRDRRPVAGDRGLGLHADLLLGEDLSGAVLRQPDQGLATSARAQQCAGDLDQVDECGAADVVHVEYGPRRESESMGDLAHTPADGDLRQLTVGEDDVHVVEIGVAVPIEQTASAATIMSAEVSSSAA